MLSPSPEYTVPLSQNEKRQIMASLMLWWRATASQLSTNYVEYVRDLSRKLKVLKSTGRVALIVTEKEGKIIRDALQYQRSLVQYASETAPPIGQLGETLKPRRGPAEMVHLGPLIRKFAEAMGEITEETNPELREDPEYQ